MNALYAYVYADIVCICKRNVCSYVRMCVYVASVFKCVYMWALFDECLL